MDQNEPLFIALKKEILGELKSDRNGAVVDSMRDYAGGEPFFSYGVTIPKIKATVRPYAPDHALAEALFDSRIRELKLAAVYADDPETVTPEQMERWRADFHSLEIAENAASMLFFAAPDALATAGRWLENDDPYTARAGLLMVGKRAKTRYFPEEKTGYLALLPALKKLAGTDNILIQSGMVNALTALYPRGTEFSDFADTVRDDAETHPALRDELAWRIEYL